MWYALHVETGKEESVKEYCKQLMDEAVYTDIFVLRFNKLKKYCGEWHQESKVMFPGYLFIDTDKPNQVYQELRKIPKYVNLLGTDKEFFVPIETSKEELFKTMIDNNHEIGISIGLIEGDKVIITEGPLAGKEAMIKKIDRHKRQATLNMEMFGNSIGVTVGLEIVEKR